MNLFFWICVILFIASLGIGTYVIMIIKNRSHDVPDDYVVDADTSIQYVLKRGGRMLRNISGFVVIGFVSLYRVIAQRLHNQQLIQKIFRKIQF